MRYRIKENKKDIIEELKEKNLLSSFILHSFKYWLDLESKLSLIMKKSSSMKFSDKFIFYKFFYGFI